jgi:hypothetical protein
MQADPSRDRKRWVAELSKLTWIFWKCAGLRRRMHQALSRIATDGTQGCRRLRHNEPVGQLNFLGNASWSWLGNSRDLSDVKGEPDPKRGALVDGTLHCDSPAMFLNDAFHDREA